MALYYTPELIRMLRTSVSLPELIIYIFGPYMKVRNEIFIISSGEVTEISGRSVDDIYKTHLDCFETISKIDITEEYGIDIHGNDVSIYLLGKLGTILSLFMIGPPKPTDELATNIRNMMNG